MTERRTIVWFSCGAASAVAAKLCPEAEPVYCETGAEHPDNVRFMADCEKWLGRNVLTLYNGAFVDTWDVWERRKYLAGIDGAPCTVELKVKPRLDFQRPTDIHVFGYTSDAPDAARAGRMRANYPELTLRFPLIERGIDKAACIAMVERAGIKRPVLYAMGFQNNNCIPCVKATSPSSYGKNLLLPEIYRILGEIGGIESVPSLSFKKMDYEHLVTLLQLLEHGSLKMRLLEAELSRRAIRQDATADNE